MIPESSAPEPIIEYEAPAVIYEGKITTRAGSELGSGPADFDPSLLFGSD
ncbi:MAG: hypothetical protein RRC07_02915 [Anaerolineae bacterium]|nr:hypothetical protein [Anaerolineae bacterium]